MKKLYSLLGAMLVGASLFAQTNYICEFSSNVEWDSIQVKNMVSGKSKMLYYPDNLITLQQVESGQETEQGQQQEGQVTAIETVENSAFIQQTANNIVVVNVETTSRLSMTLYSIGGNVVARYAKNVNAGQYAFKIDASSGVYVLVATTRDETASVKLSLQGNSPVGISEVEIAEPVVFLKAIEDVLTFNEGEEFEFTGYYDVQKKVEYSIITDDKQFIFSFERKMPEIIENGAIKAAFSVSMHQKIYFSQGNLQYETKTGVWRFAEYQFNTIGAQYWAPEYDGCIDLFCFGTSGWSGGAKAYQPNSYSQQNSDYYIGGAPENDLTGEYANADWGVYNAISNGGNQAGLWRTLTADEFSYIMRTRANASKKYGVATVDGINGLILLPDNWILPQGLSFTSGTADYSGEKYYREVNNYTYAEWERLEENGAVFFPAAGNREYDGTYLFDEEYGDYWTSSVNGVSAKLFHFKSSEYSVGPIGRLYGMSVRLAQDVKQEISNEGVINAPFSVSENKKVNFSMGNLQYNANTDDWRFAEHQFDLIGDNNSNISSSYNGYIDLFSWGTSGFNSVYPYSKSNAAYAFYQEEQNIAETNYDWGVYNPISNGGNSNGLWRTLTIEEWNYLMTERKDADKLYSRGNIEGINGIILLPDNWTTPSSLQFTHQSDDWNTNSYSADDWNIMQSKGAVFLPANGYRRGKILYGDGGYGNYWSASFLDDYNSYNVHFNTEEIVTNNRGDRETGFGVRLVRDVE